MQRGRRVCSKVGECAARSESVQRVRRVCSVLESVQHVREYIARLNKVFVLDRVQLKIIYSFDG